MGLWSAGHSWNDTQQRRRMAIPAIDSAIPSCNDTTATKKTTSLETSSMPVFGPTASHLRNMSC